MRFLPLPQKTMKNQYEIFFLFSSWIGFGHIFLNKTFRMSLKLIRKYTLCMQHICCEESPGGDVTLERIQSLEKLITFAFWPVSWSFSYPNLTVLLTWGWALSNNRKNTGLTAPPWGLTVGLRISSQYLMAVRLPLEHNIVHGFSRSFLCLSHMLTLNLLSSVKSTGIYQL